MKSIDPKKEVRALKFLANVIDGQAVTATQRTRKDLEALVSRYMDLAEKEKKEGGKR